MMTSIVGDLAYVFMSVNLNPNENGDSVMSKMAQHHRDNMGLNLIDVDGARYIGKPTISKITKK